MINYFSGLKSIEMSKKDILDVEQLFADAAIRVKKSEFDDCKYMLLMDIC